MQTASLIAVTAIILHALWCLRCPRVSDGILGKFFYLTLCLAAFGYLSQPSPTSQALLNISFATLAARHWWMKTYWPSVKRGILKLVHVYEKP